VSCPYGDGSQSRPFNVSAMQARIAELEAVIAKHDLCHNLHGQVDARAFNDGCNAELRKLYGCAPDADDLAEAIRLLRATYRGGGHVLYSTNTKDVDALLARHQ